VLLEVYGRRWGGASKHENVARPGKNVKNPYLRSPSMAPGVTDHTGRSKRVAGLLD
jgi:hypothetical protein